MNVTKPEYSRLVQDHEVRLFVGKAGGTALPLSATFTVPNPYPFARCSVAVMRDATANAPACTLWLCARVLTQRGRLIPVFDRHGTQAAPVTIFDNAGLGGVGYEMESNVHDMQGVVTLTTVAPIFSAGDAILVRARMSRMPGTCDADWRQVCADFRIDALPAQEVAI